MKKKKIDKNYYPIKVCCPWCQKIQKIDAPVNLCIFCLKCFILKNDRKKKEVLKIGK